jgi:hypothetical protein
MAAAAASCGRPDAAHDVARDLLALAGVPERKKMSGRANGIHPKEAR